MSQNYSNQDIMKRVVNKLGKEIFTIIDKHYIIRNITEDGDLVFTVLDGGLYRRFGGSYRLPHEAIIFSHKFAKAFWGEDKCYHFDEGAVDDDNVLILDIPEENKHLLSIFGSEGNYHWYQPIWAYHLQQLVLAENRMEYLKKFIEE